MANNFDKYCIAKANKNLCKKLLKSWVYVTVNPGILMFVQTSFALASGGYSGGSGGNYNRQAKPVDQTYEVGKAIFKGRKSGEPSLEYCVLSDGEKVPLKRSSVQEFKNSTYDEFAKSLFQCDKPESLVSEGLTRDSLLYVLYYLNKRHKLKLKGS